MKRFRSLVCAAALGICMATVAGAAEGVGNLPPQGAKAYLELINTAQQLHGTARVAQGMWEGVCLAKLIDFDGDGIPELYYAEKPAGSYYTQRLYTYHDGEIVQLKIPEDVSNFGTDVSPSALFYIGDGKAYLVDGHEVMNGNDVNYFTKQNDDIVSDFVYTAPDLGESKYTVNGKNVTKQELGAQKNALTRGMAEVSYSFWSQESDSLGKTVTQTIGELQTLIKPTAVTSSDRLVVDGKQVQMPVYKIAGNNYYMLRGLAQALSGTEAQFEVEWDGNKSRITLTKGKPYTPVGGESGNITPAETSATLTTASIYLEGQPLALTVYNIRGNNFFKLRDIGQALDFSIGWNEGERTISIDTAQPYDAKSLS